MKGFIDEIRKLTTLSEEAESAIRGCLKKNDGKKGDILLREGQICQQVWFLDKGLARVYYFTEDKEVTDWIGLEGSFILAIPSFFIQTPSSKTVELLEDSEYTSIGFTDLEKLYAKTHELERIGRVIGNFALMLMSKRIEEVLFMTSAQRYEIMMKLHPEILQRVPLGIVASYLGMAQETLSRMRANN